MLRNWFSVAGFGVLALGTVLFFQFSDGSVIEKVSLSAQEIDAKKNTVVTINNVEIPVEIANTFEQRSRGLSFRESLDKNTGMLFIFDRPQRASFWMYEMNFPIDIIWINNGKITGIEREVPHPKKETETKDLPTYPSPGEVDLVLEVNSGEAANFKVGDEIDITNTNIL